VKKTALIISNPDFKIGKTFTLDFRSSDAPLLAVGCTRVIVYCGGFFTGYLVQRKKDGKAK